ncbi:MAU2 chromatid cohesion factor [Naviculisporaceae sp. PSN 640]
MIYRETMPPGQAHGQAYNGQQPNRPIQNAQPFQHIQGQPRQPQIGYPQYANANSNGLNGYAVNGGVAPAYQPHQAQYSQPAYPQQPPPQQQQQQQQQYPRQQQPQATAYYSNNAAHLTNYTAPISHARPADITPPLEFVNPSFLQNNVPPRPPVQAQPKAQPQTQPSPAPVKVEASMSPQLQQITSAKASPRNSPILSENRTLPAGSAPRTSAKDPRRQASAGGITKSPVLSQSPAHVETLPILLSVAEDCFSQAGLAAHGVAKSLSRPEVEQHHKLVATGLGCLELALKSSKLPPRLEARLCLRYASILTEETTNLMEAETALSRGIAVCEKHRLLDLKYSSVFLLMKTLFQRNQKAAFKSIDGHINECTTFKVTHWIYAFRFLKASFHLQAGSPADIHAVENLKKIAFMAHSRDEKAIFVLATLLEGLAHLSTMKDDWATRVQTCIAQASKLQLDETINLPQLDILLLLLDLACSLRQKSHVVSFQKLSILQKRLDELRDSAEWTPNSNEILLPIWRSHGPATISKDTSAILRPGEAVDYLVLSALGKQETYALAFVFNGIVALTKATTPGKSSSLWSEAVRILQDNKAITTSQSLPEALKNSDWAKELACYSHVLIGLQSATLCDWAKVKSCLQAIQEIQPSSEFLEMITLYLTGVFHQGTANLSEALGIWKDERFDLERKIGAKNHVSTVVQTELSILSALNQIWIMQEPAYQNDVETGRLVDQLRPLCEDNPDSEIRTAYHLVLASCNFNPPFSINQIKSHIQHSLAGAQQTSNTQCLSIALNTMRCRLFENVVGEQALKSARAGSAQAKKSGNILWMSVAEGMLAQSYEMQGALADAQLSREMAIKLANEARSKTSV